MVDVTIDTPIVAKWVVMPIVELSVEHRIKIISPIIEEQPVNQLNQVQNFQDLTIDSPIVAKWVQMPIITLSIKYTMQIIYPVTITNCFIYEIPMFAQHAKTAEEREEDMKEAVRAHWRGLIRESEIIQGMPKPLSAPAKEAFDLLMGLHNVKLIECVFMTPKTHVLSDEQYLSKLIME